MLVENKSDSYAVIADKSRWAKIREDSRTHGIRVMMYTRPWYVVRVTSSTPGLAHPSGSRSDSVRRSRHHIERTYTPLLFQTLCHPLEMDFCKRTRVHHVSRTRDRTTATQTGYFPLRRRFFFLIYSPPPSRVFSIIINIVFITVFVSLFFFRENLLRARVRARFLHHLCVYTGTS